MTTINISRDCNVYTLKATGHAEYSELGTDIVCSAISILLSTLVVSLGLPEQQGLCKVFSVDMTPGNVFIHFYVSVKKKAIVDTIITGLSLIADEYPENCRLELGGGLAKPTQ